MYNFHQIFPKMYFNFWHSQKPNAVVRKAGLISLVSQMRFWEVCDLPETSKPAQLWSQNSNPGLGFPNPILCPPHLTASAQGHAVEGCWRNEWKRKQKCKAWKPFWNLEGLSISKQLKCHAQSQKEFAALGVFELLQNL